MNKKSTAASSGCARRGCLSYSSVSDVHLLEK